jgi:hypothetical protein
MTVTSSRLLLAAIAGVTLTVLFDTPLQKPGFAQSNDPCTATLSLVAATGGSAARAQTDGREPKRRPLDHDDRWRHLDGLYKHRAAIARGRVAQTALESPTVNSQSPDVGDIAVLQDAGDLMITPNPLDLRDAGLRLTPNNRRGYDAGPLPFAFRQPLGSAIDTSLATD